MLHWLKSANKKLPVFVAHRVGEIQDLTSIEDWNHVGTKENPADLVSRGCNPKELLSSNLWWQGPAWLQNDGSINSKHHSTSETSDNFESCKDDIPTTLIATHQQEENWLHKFSTFSRLVRVPHFVATWLLTCHLVVLYLQAKVFFFKFRKTFF